MENLILWLWGPGCLAIVVAMALYLNRRDKMHPGE